MMSMSRPGKRALALVASISLSRLYVRSGMGLYHFHAPTPSRWAPTCRDRLANYRSSVLVLKARRLAATTTAAPRGRTDPRLLETRTAFHLHRLMPVGRELCRPHCLAFPLYPKQRTSSGRPGTSEKCRQEPTSKKGAANRGGLFVLSCVSPRSSQADPWPCTYN